MKYPRRLWLVLLMTVFTITQGIVLILLNVGMMISRLIYMPFAILTESRALVVDDRWYFYNKKDLVRLLRSIEEQLEAWYG